MNQRMPSAPARDSAVRRAVRRVALLRESPVGMIGAGIVLFLVFVAVLAPLIDTF